MACAVAAFAPGRPAAARRARLTAAMASGRTRAGFGAATACLVAALIYAPHCVAQSPASAGAGAALTFGAAIEAAVETHSAIQKAVGQAEQAEEGIDAARAGYYPQPSAGVSTRASNGQISGYSDKQVRQASLTVTQMLYDFGKVEGAVGEAQGLAGAARARALRAPTTSRARRPRPGSMPIARRRSSKRLRRNSTTWRVSRRWWRSGRQGCDEPVGRCAGKVRMGRRALPTAGSAGTGHALASGAHERDPAGRPARRRRGPAGSAGPGMCRTARRVGHIAACRACRLVRAVCSAGSAAKRKGTDLAGVGAGSWQCRRPRGVGGSAWSLPRTALESVLAYAYASGECSGAYAKRP